MLQLSSRLKAAVHRDAFPEVERLANKRYEQNLDECTCRLVVGSSEFEMSAAKHFAKWERLQPLVRSCMFDVFDPTFVTKFFSVFPLACARTGNR